MIDVMKIEQAFRTMIDAIGESKVGEEPFKNSPKRVAKMWVDELLVGYDMNPERILEKDFELSEYDEMIVVNPIEFYSTCEHHLVPFFGHVHLAYIPKGKVVGLSKIPRLIDVYARRLQIQERMTCQIADTFMKYVIPQGCYVVIEGVHFCTKSRGIQKQCITVTTSAERGIFKSDVGSKNEAMKIIEWNRRQKL